MSSVFVFHLYGKNILVTHHFNSLGKKSITLILAPLADDQMYIDLLSKPCVVDQVVLVLPKNVLLSVNADPSRPHPPSGTVYFYRLHLKYILVS